MPPFRYWYKYETRFVLVRVCRNCGKQTQLLCNECPSCGSKGG